MDDWYSLPAFDQPLSSLSHFVGAVVFAVLSAFLLQPAWRDRERFWYLAVFGFSSVVLLSISGVYHMLAPGGIARAVMLRLDVAAVFVLIAASFTPVHGILFTGWKRWGILVPVWLIAVLGIILRTIFFDSISTPVGAGVFLMMGWIGAGSAYLLWKENQWRMVLPLASGGVLYTIGAVANVASWPTIIPYVWGPHETFHFAVLAGLSCHWWIALAIANETMDRVPAVQTPSLGIAATHEALETG